MTQEQTRLFFFCQLATNSYGVMSNHIQVYLIVHCGFLNGWLWVSRVIPKNGQYHQHNALSWGYFVLRHPHPHPLLRSTWIWGRGPHLFFLIAFNLILTPMSMWNGLSEGTVCGCWCPMTKYQRDQGICGIRRCDQLHRYIYIFPRDSQTSPDLRDSLLSHSRCQEFNSPWCLLGEEPWAN